jgi:hypothetical protein
VPSGEGWIHEMKHVSGGFKQIPWGGTSMRLSGVAGISAAHSIAGTILSQVTHTFSDKWAWFPPKPRGRKRALSPASGRENHKRVVDLVRLARNFSGKSPGGLVGDAG